MQTALELAQGRTHGLENMFAAARVLREAQVPANSPQSIDLFRKLLRLPDQDAMRRHVQGSTQQLAGVPLREAAGTPTGRTYTPAVRKLLATEGKARPDGSYPIRDAKDVEDAVDDFNRASGSDEDKAHIVERAKAVAGGTDKLPADWSASTRLQEAEVPGWAIPMVGGGTLGQARLREATSLAELGQAGIPLRSTSPLAAQRHSELPPGIPTLAPGTGALRRVPLAESASGTVVRRISP
jgi:hypothetical protein